MKTLEEIKNVLRSKKQALREKYHVARIGVFGSYVRGDNTPASDVDILIE
ncbi:MAG: nucleotidyltransferase domain-containing protein, partial [Candidatus Omnitrophica bacterium]|nr:nucleotidyltransferase domain-containing protein [Candidatus Omnitrophota bacterium]